ncbi:hypothetical protein BVRB_7g163440 [Beta vulgaris subsp. vulgaris]|nr:hypothetical protein BVRB_7g163440 [Beta vulgaris subsp. vulgaris]
MLGALRTSHMMGRGERSSAELANLDRASACWFSYRGMEDTYGWGRDSVPAAADSSDEVGDYTGSGAGVRRQRNSKQQRTTQQEKQRRAKEEREKTASCSRRATRLQRAAGGETPASSANRRRIEGKVWRGKTRTAGEGTRFRQRRIAATRLATTQGVAPAFADSETPSSSEQHNRRSKEERKKRERKQRAVVGGRRGSDEQQGGKLRQARQIAGELKGRCGEVAVKNRGKGMGFYGFWGFNFGGFGF